MNKLRISVAMCTYNGARFLPEQLASLAAQTRLPDELVICDDGSTDDTVAVANAFRCKAPFPTRLEVNDTNLGIAKNFERAISLCTGDIIALSDQDDVWHPEKLRRMANVFEDDKRVGAVFSDAELIDEQSRPLGKTLWNSYRFTSRERYRFKTGRGLTVLLRHATVTGATMAFRSEFRGLALPIPPDQVHDHWIALLIAAVSHLFPMDERLVKYRRHRAQQIGPGAWESLPHAISASKHSGRSHYVEEIVRFNEICERIVERSAQYPHHSNVIGLIQQKINHRRVRGSLPSSKLLRIPLLVREIANCHYWRYSSGLGSVAKDLFV